MKKVKAGIPCVTAVCVLLGVIVGLQAKSVKLHNSVYSINRVSELSSQLTNMQSENESLRQKLDESEKKLDEYESVMSEGNTSLKTILENSENLKKEAGRTALTGRGISVTLNDSQKAKDSSGVDKSAFLVHAEDILSITNELFSAGAEAVSINGQRLVATSSVRCAGSVVNINGVKIAAPFVISAIGDPDILEAALIFPGGVADSLSPWGIELDIKKSDKIDVPAFSGTISFNESRRLETEG